MTQKWNLELGNYVLVNLGLNCLIWRFHSAEQCTGHLYNAALVSHSSKLGNFAPFNLVYLTEVLIFLRCSWIGEEIEWMYQNWDVWNIYIYTFFFKSEHSTPILILIFSEFENVQFRKASKKKYQKFGNFFRSFGFFFFPPNFLGIFNVFQSTI